MKLNLRSNIYTTNLTDISPIQPRIVSKHKRVVSLTFEWSAYYSGYYRNFSVEFFATLDVDGVKYTLPQSGILVGEITNFVNYVDLELKEIARINYLLDDELISFVNECAQKFVGELETGRDVTIDPS